MGNAAIVTGGASGIGQAVAERLAKDNFKIVILDINGDAGKAAAAEIQARGQNAHFIRLDVTQESAIKEIFQKIISDHRRIDVLVNVVRHPELVGEPERQRHQVRLEAPRRARDVGFEESRKLDQRLLVEAHKVQLCRCRARLAQAVLDGLRWEPGIVLLARESLLLRGSFNFAVDYQGSGTVVVESRNPEDGGHET